MWHTSLTKDKQTSSKAFRKGPCALYFMECVITTPSLLREYQRWQTGERRCADTCSRRCSKPTTTYTISISTPPPPGHVTTLFVTLGAYGVPRCKTNRCKNSFVPYVVSLAVNGLPYLHTNIIGFEH